MPNQSTQYAFKLGLTVKTKASRKSEDMSQSSQVLAPLTMGQNKPLGA